MELFKDFAGMLRREFAGYGGGKLFKDLLSGVTVAAVALPLALAFGVGSGASAAAGLITAIIAGLVIGGLSGGSFQISGPTGAMTAILVTLVAQYGLQGIFVACLISGVLLVLAGILRLGRLVSYIPLAVITGFTSGIAIIIALGQVDNLTGLRSHGTESLERIASYFTNPQTLDLPALGIGLAVILFMALYPKKWGQYCPGSLAAIVLATGANMFLRLPVASVGEIPRTLFLAQRLDLSALQPAQIRDLFFPAVSIAALGMIESLLCGACGGRMKGEPLHSGIELISQGIGNILLPFFGGLPATAAIARTSVAIKSGCQTRLTSVIHAAVLLLSMFALGGVMQAIPLPALAGVLIMTAWRMNEWHVIRDIFGRRIRSQKWQFIITMAATVVFDLTVAIVIGVLFSLAVFIVKISDMKVTVSEVDPERLGLSANPRALHRTSVVYLTGPLYFGTANAMQERLSSLTDRERIIFSMRGVPFADASGIQALREVCVRLQAEGTQIYFASLQPAVEEMFNRCLFTEHIGAEYFYWSTDQILHALAD